ncbi:fumarate hydratase [bacterium]|nr:fumarate hydratase [Candidatus Omnitrophota bacterium]MBU2529312.1 fumarate hydratase [bacterium]MBU3930544.1 fumarate hydratase [bacterium]MBU4123165.1 fumarate hydratase [bacterium]
MTNLEEKILRANYELTPDVSACIRKALKNEKSPRGRQFLKLIEENIAIAKKKSFPLCQDTGIVSFHVGAHADIRALREAVRKSYGRLRDSQVRKPFDRKVDKRNLPSVNLAPDDFTPSFLIRGGGAMNCSGLISANPSSDANCLEREIAAFVISKAPYCCPPVFVGVGIGGAPHDAMLASERMLLKDQCKPMSRMENKIYAEINRSGIGPGGWGGKNTVLCVRIGELPMHMATMSVGISMSCWCLRKGKI